jgi:hypothetical protein
MPIAPPVIRVIIEGDDDVTNNIVEAELVAHLQSLGFECEHFAAAITAPSHAHWLSEILGHKPRVRVCVRSVDT